MDNDRCADGVRVAYPLFRAGGGGSTPTSALSLLFVRIGLRTAVALNRCWHSRLPQFDKRTQTIDRCACYAAEFAGLYYAVAIWTNPVSRLFPPKACLELRRLAIAPDAPRNAASRMLGWMVRDLRPRFPSVARLVSYQDCDAHRGTIYRAAGWTAVALPPVSGHDGWCRRARKRKSKGVVNKVRWEKMLAQSGSVTCPTT